MITFLAVLSLITLVCLLSGATIQERNHKGSTSILTSIGITLVILILGGIMDQRNLDNDVGYHKKRILEITYCNLEKIVELKKQIKGDK